MLAENKNLKDPERKPAASYGAGPEDMSVILSYTKTHKLITALYMVTDIIDKDEPLRNKLRTLGVEILSDTSTMSKAAFDIRKIDQVLSFLDIASAMNFISEMNCAILKKEFFELKKALEESTQTKPTWLEEFLLAPSPKEARPNVLGLASHTDSKGHTRIGVQKGSTLMKALSNKTGFLSNNNSTHLRRNDFNIFKKQRRDVIISLIKASPSGVTITDIKAKASGLPAGEAGPLISCSEKTLQRELVSMIQSGVLNKTGQKRWSRYFIKN